MRPLALLALGAAVVAFVVHLLAVAGRTPLGMTIIVIVFPIAFLCFAAFIRDANKRSGTRRVGVADLVAPLPTWARVLFVIVFSYVGLNFALFWHATGGGTVEQRPDGRYVLSDHGRVIRPLDEEGVRTVHTWQVRAFSGHILPFLVLPGLYFLFVPRSRRSNTE
jgi:hypothetical protein